MKIEKNCTCSAISRHELSIVNNILAKKIPYNFLPMRLRTTTTLLISLGFCAPLVQAADFNWQHSGEGNWLEGGNWDIASPPSYGSGVNINNGGTAIINAGESAAAGVVSVGNQSGNEGSLVIRDGSLSAISINVGNGGTGNLLIDGGSLTTASEPHMRIGVAGGTGTIIINNNGQMRIGSEINVGSSGEGTLILNSGLVHAVWAMRIGENTGSVGRVVVNGGLITNGMDNNFVVGRAGTGTLEINNDGRVNSDWAFFGGEIYRGGLVAQGNGTVNMTGNSLFDNTAGIVMSAGASSVSQATINDSSTMTTANSLYIGYDGTANLTINDSGRVNSNSAMLVGMNAGSRGYLTLNDDATATVGYLYSGYSGYGETTLNGGSLNSVSSIYLGRMNTGNGVITVNDGLLKTPASLYIGYDGRGTLVINGGTVRSEGAVWVGTSASGNGTLKMNGGVLETNQLAGYAGSASVSFDGGTIRALSDNATFIKDTGPITVNAGGGTIDSNGKNIGITSSFISSDRNAMLTKTGAGTLTLGTDNSGYLGGIQINQGTLSLGIADTIRNADSITLSGNSILDTLNSNQTLQTLNGDSGTSLLSGTGNLTLYNATGRDSVFAGQISGSGLLNKTGDGMLTLSGSGSTQGAADVQQGTLRFSQSGAFNVAGDYVTRSGAITDIGRDQSQLVVGGSFTQESGAGLTVTIGASPDIVADSASLDGNIIINGFAAGPTPVKASVATTGNYTVIHTQNGITGYFVNAPLPSSGLDYLLHDGHVSADGKDYNLGFRLAWTDGGDNLSTGMFTVNDGTAFDVDIVLGDRVVPGGGFGTGWDGRSLLKAGDGLLALSAVNTYSGSTTVNAGTLRTDIANTLASSSEIIVNGGVLDLNGNDQQLNRLSGSGGAVWLNGAGLTAVNASSADNTRYDGDVLDGSVSGGRFIKAGDGSLTLAGQTGWRGDTWLNAGELILDGVKGGAQLTSNIIGTRGSRLGLHNGAVLTGWIDPTDVEIDTASRWNMTASSLVDHLSNAGTINIAAPGVNNFKTLTVQGNYHGDNGLIVLNTRLESDDSPTDRLVVQGDTAGQSRLQIVNAGGSGASTRKNGIEVVSVSGLSNGQFSLAAPVVAGAYDYQLFQGDANGQGGNWYLRSGSDNIRSETGVYLRHLSAASTQFLHTLHDRLGEPQYTDSYRGQGKASAGWVRITGNHSDSQAADGRIDVDTDSALVHFGGDLARWSRNGNDRWHLGLMGGYGHSEVDANRQGSRSASGKVDGYSVGAYATWYGNSHQPSGPYVDVWAQYAWYDNQVQGQGLAQEKYHSSGWTLSAESGYAFVAHDGAKRQWLIEPQAQIAWNSYSADDHQEANGTWVRDGNADGVIGRLGARVYSRSKLGDNGVQPFVETNWWYSDAKNSLRFDGDIVSDDTPRNRYEVKAGLQGEIVKGWQAWGYVGGQWGENSYSRYEGMVGVKRVF